MIKLFKNKILKLFVYLILFFVVIFLYSKYIGINGLEVREYRIESSVLTNNFSGLKVVHFSDLKY